MAERVVHSRVGGRWLAWILGCGGAALTLAADEVGYFATMSPFPVVAPAPVSLSVVGMAQPVLELAREPRIDLQTRGGAERQADISIRGGTFESTGVLLGGLALLDPQTGHYFAELPIDPAFLEPARLLTGFDNALLAFNATAGAVAWDWAPVRPGQHIHACLGSHGLNYQGALGAWRLAGDADAEDGVYAQGGFTRAEGHGSRPGGDFAYVRWSGRLQWRRGAARTDLFAGYADKFQGWPGMYTGRDFLAETDHTRVLLAGGEHRLDYGADSHWRAGAWFRRLVDDYEFNRTAPNNLFEHTTEVWSVQTSGRHVLGAGWSVDYRGVLLADRIVRSTALVHAPYHDRRYGKLALAAAHAAPVADGRTVLTTQAGLVLDTADVHSTRVSPLAGLELRGQRPAGWWRAYLEYAQSTQVPGYTAVASSPAGLFGGNAALGREVSRQFDAGLALGGDHWWWRAAAFLRADRDLTDWTYAAGSPNLRQANAVDIDVPGLETALHWEGGVWSISAGYAWLGKSADYGAAQVDASYYALNYARHRASLALALRLPAGWTALAEGEWRRQAANALRTGGRDALRLAAGIEWRPPAWPRWEFALRGENLTQDGFADFPGTPGERRRFSLQAACRF